MSLLAEIEAAASPRRGPACSIETVLAELPDSERAELEKALASARYLGSDIAKVLRGRGFHVANLTVNRHRRGDCRCAR